jgi:DNA invertase Pin-like site-specific DNA recombinase
VPAEFQDVQTSRNLKERPGLMAAVRIASENKLFETVLVYRVDLLARNVSSYPTLKTKLRQAGVRIVSYVEHFAANPTPPRMATSSRSQRSRDRSDRRPACLVGCFQATPG